MVRPEIPAGRNRGTIDKVVAGAQRPPRSDSNLARDLERALRNHPHSAALQNALGLAVTRTNADAGVSEASALVASDHFRQAVASQPSHIMAGLNYAEALAAAGKKDAAVSQARTA